MCIMSALLLKIKARILLEQRPETGLLANMWLFPIEEISKNNFNNCKNWRNQQKRKTINFRVRACNRAFGR